MLPALFLTFLVAGLAHAQVDEASQAAHGKSWYDLFKTTGVVGWMLLACSIIGTSLLTQFLMTMNKKKLSNSQLLTDVEDLLSSGSLDQAIGLVEGDGSYTGRVLFGSLVRRPASYEEARTGMEEAAAVEAFRLNAKISMLSLIGNIGPLLGLLGTVTGMIASFQVIETMKAPTPGDLAKGVYESLVNTTIGLFIAIVFLSAYFFMKNKLSGICLRINNEISAMFARSLAGAAQDSSV
jgi:biopolymer transport protein ExbB